MKNQVDALPPLNFKSRHYRALLAHVNERAEGEHPADAIVGRMPGVAAVDRKVWARAEEMEDARRRGDDDRWTEYEDLRFLQRARREERFFDVGYEMGRLDGLGGSCEAARTARARALRRAIQRAVVTSAASRAEAIAALLDAARGLALAGGRGGGPKRERGAVARRSTSR